MNRFEILALCATVILLVVTFALMYHRDAARDCPEFDDMTTVRRAQAERAALARCVHCGGRVDGGV